MKFLAVIGLLLATVCNAEITLMLKNVTVLEGSNAVIPCTYTATDTEVTPRISWSTVNEDSDKVELLSLKKGGPATKNKDLDREFSIGDDGELSIPATTIGDNKIFSTLVCEVYFDDEMKKAGQLNFAVVAFADKKPKTSLEEKVFTAGSSPVAIGKCVTGNAYPTPKVFFYKGSEEIQSESGDEVIGEETDDFLNDFLNDNVVTSEGDKVSVSRSLVRPVSKEDDNAAFFCVVISGEGDKIDVQNVTFPKFRVRYPTDEVEIVASEKKLFVGDEVTFTCVTNGYPTPMLRFQEQKSRSFKMVLQEDDHGRQITCRASYDDESAPLEASYTIEALYANEPSIAGETMVQYGEAISLTCSPGKSIPVPTKTFWKKGDIVVSDTAQLNIAMARFEDAGIFTCVVENDYENLKRTIDSKPITVNGLMLKDPSDKQVQGELKKTVVLSCSVTSFPEPTFTWRNVSGKTTRVGKVTNEGNTYTSSITVGPLEPSMSNEKFECVIENGESPRLSKTYTLPGLNEPPENPTPEEEVLPETASPTAGIIIGILVVALIIGIVLAVLYKKGIICKSEGKGEEDAEDIEHVKMKSDNGASNRNDIEAGYEKTNIEQEQGTQLIGGADD